MDYLFSGSKELTNISNIEALETKSVISKERIFNYCKKLSNFKYLKPISNFNASKAESFQKKFKDCRTLINLPDLSNWDMQRTKNLRGMFKNFS